jgi:hypothetical protein
MIKLTEVLTFRGDYDPKKQKVNSKYGLRSVYINSDYVVSVRECDTLTEQNKREIVVEGLSPSARFSKVHVASSGSTLCSYDVLGSPETVAHKLSSGEER